MSVQLLTLRPLYFFSLSSSRKIHGSRFDHSHMLVNHSDTHPFYCFSLSLSHTHKSTQILFLVCGNFTAVSKNGKSNIALHLQAKGACVRIYGTPPGQPRWVRCAATCPARVMTSSAVVVAPARRTRSDTRSPGGPWSWPTTWQTTGS